MDIETQSANVTIYAKEKDFTSIKYTTISGEFKSNLTYTANGSHYAFNGPVGEYEVSTISGYLKVLNKQ